MRAVMAEDSVLLRAGLERLLADADIETVGAVDDAEGLLREVERLQAAGNVCIVDVRMPPTYTDEGVRAALGSAAGIRTAHPGAVAVRRGALRRRPDRWPYPRPRLPVEGPRGGRRGVPRRGPPGRRRGTALDPEVVAQLLVRSRQRDPLASLTPREREVLGLMAEGRSNAAISRQLVISAGAVEKHVSSVFVKLGLEPGPEDHRRVLAVLRYLGAASGSST